MAKRKKAKRKATKKAAPRKKKATTAKKPAKPRTTAAQKREADRAKKHAADRQAAEAEVQKKADAEARTKAKFLEHNLELIETARTAMAGVGGHSYIDQVAATICGRIVILGKEISKRLG